MDEDGRDAGMDEEGKEAGRGEERERGWERGERLEGKRLGKGKGIGRGREEEDRNQRVREGGASGIASHDILPHAYDSVLIIPLSRFCGVVAYALCEVRVCQQPYDSVGQSLC